MKYVVTRSPFNALSTLNNFDRMFNNFWSDFPTASNVKLPKVDIRENDKEYILEAELPGYGEKDIDVNIEKHILTISSVEDVKTEETHEEFLIKERRSNSFQRSFVLPEGVFEDKIKAEYKNGILILVIPKLPAKQPKKIAIKIAS